MRYVISKNFNGRRGAFPCGDSWVVTLLGKARVFSQCRNIWHQSRTTSSSNAYLSVNIT